MSRKPYLKPYFLNEYDYRFAPLWLGYYHPIKSYTLIMDPNTVQSNSKCPECFEPVNPQATKCKHCTADIYHCPNCRTNVTVVIRYYRTSGWSWDESAMGFCSKCDKQISGPQKSDCFIATAAYGTPIAPEINVLRYLRDEQISKYTLGRTFIKSYETISPPIAKYIYGRNILRLLVRIGLSPIILVCKLIIQLQSRTVRSQKKK